MSDASKCGLSATASRVIASRSSADSTFFSSLNGEFAAGMKRTFSRPYASRTYSAVSRWPMWIGSNVPPMIPMPFMTHSPRNSLTTNARAAMLKSMSPAAFR